MLKKEKKKVKYQQKNVNVNENILTEIPDFFSCTGRSSLKDYHVLLATLMDFLELECDRMINWNEKENIKN